MLIYGGIASNLDLSYEKMLIGLIIIRGIHFILLLYSYHINVYNNPSK